MMKAELFYAYVRLVASTDPGCLQSEFDTLTGIFERAGLRTNIGNTVGVVFRPCRAARVQADKA